MALLFLIGFIVIIALPSVLWLYALADVIINEFRSLITKFVWALFLCFFPPLGTLLYFLIGRSQRITYYPVGRVVVICILLVPVVMGAIVRHLAANQRGPYKKREPDKLAA